MGFLALAVSVALSSGLFYAVHPFPHDRRTDPLAIVVLGVMFAIVCAPIALFFPDLAVIAPVLPAIALPIAMFIIYTRLRHLARMTRMVLNPHLRAGAFATLKAYVAKFRTNVRSGYARRAAWVLAGAGLLDEAESILADVPLERLYRSHRALLANDLAAWRLRLGNVKGAREALSIAVRPSAAYESILSSKDAVLFALEGQPDAALVIAQRLSQRKLGPAHRATVALANAHAHAAKGDVEAARKALGELAALVPDVWVERATTPIGPASAIATAFAAEKTSPYR